LIACDILVEVQAILEHTTAITIGAIASLNRKCHIEW
jgi:hypothetical protein